jgi:putative hydrolase of the HAD superfamily
MYAEAAKKYGVDADPVEVFRRFREAYQEQERIDAANNWRVDEAREVERWRAIVKHSLPGTPEACFQDLYQHFAQPDAWQCPEGLAEVLEQFHHAGIVMGLASNYDTRLRSVIAGRPELARLRDHVLISSELGIRKPGRGFFDAVIQASGCPASEILFVGDDVENDYEGAMGAGLHAVLLDPTDRYPMIPQCIRSLTELPEFLQPRC